MLQSLSNQSLGGQGNDPTMPTRKTNNPHNQSYKVCGFTEQQPYSNKGAPQILLEGLFKTTISINNSHLLYGLDGLNMLK